MKLKVALCLLVAHHVIYQAFAAADAAPAAAGQHYEQLEAGQAGRLPPLLQALSILRPTITITDVNGNPSSRSRPTASASLAVPPTSAAATQAPLDTLRPAAAAVLARQHSNTVPLTDDDIAAINILLGREEPPSRPYTYNTGLPMSDNASVPHLLTFGNYTPSGKNGSMQSSEKLNRMRPLGPLSWLARQFAVSGDTLVKLRITQQLQLILQDAISDSAASSANLPPNQVVTFASTNLSLSLGFTGVDWDDGVPPGVGALEAGTAEAQAGLPHKGLVAVQQALNELTRNYDLGHTLVSFEPFTSSSTVVAKAAAGPGQKAKQGSSAAGAGARAGGADAGGSSGNMQPVTANSARKLLLRPRQQQQRGAASSGSSSSSRHLSAAGDSKVVYIRLYGMDPMNLTTVMDKLGNCSTQQQAAAPTSGRMQELPAGMPLAPWCAEVFRKHFQQQGLPVLPGTAFKVAPEQKPQATIGLAVAIGLTRDQQVSAGTDAKAGAWLNGTSMQDIFGTFNLTVASSDADYIAYLRDKESGQYPALPGLNLSALIPTLVQTVIAANKSLSELEQQQQQKAVAPGAAAALNRAVLAGIIVAVVASVLALAGVVVLLLRRRSDSKSRGQQQEEGGGAGPNRRRKVGGADVCACTPLWLHLCNKYAAVNHRKSELHLPMHLQPIIALTDHSYASVLYMYCLQRRPRVYHNKYLPDSGPVVGPEPQSDATGTTTRAAAGAAAAEDSFPRHTLERGDSVMSQVHIEMDEAQDEVGTQGSSDVGSSQGSSPSAAAAAGLGLALHHQHARQHGNRAHQQQQQPHKQQQPQRQDGVVGSSGSTVSSANSSGRQQMLDNQRSGSASTSVVLVPADSSAWDDNGSGSMRTMSVDLTGNSSSVLSPWASQGEVQGPAVAAAAAVEGKQGSRTAGSRHRLAVASQAVAADEQQEQQQQQHGEGADGSSSSRPAGYQHQQQLSVAGVPAAAARQGSFNIASAFAAMDAQLAAAVRASAAGDAGSRELSSGGGSNASAKAVQPLGASCWHKGGHVSGFLVPEAAAAAAGGGIIAGGAALAPGLRRSTTGGLVSPFAAAIQLAHSVASDDWRVEGKRRSTHSDGV